MNVINTHFPNFRTIPTELHMVGDWGYGSKGGIVVVPPNVHVYSGDGEDFTDIAEVSPSTYGNGTTETVTVSVNGVCSDGTWGTVSVQKTITLNDAELVFMDAQPVQEEGKVPDIRLSMRVGEDQYVEVPSSQVRIVSINGATGVDSWVMGMGTQTIICSCTYDVGTNRFGTSTGVPYFVEGEVEVKGFGMTDMSIDLFSDDPYTTRTVNLLPLDGNMPDVSVEPLNTEFSASISNGVLRMVVDSSAFTRNEGTYSVVLSNGDYTGSYSIRVRKRMLTRMSVSGSLPIQEEGKPFDLGQVQFTAYYEGGYSKKLSNADLILSPSIVPSDASTASLSVSYRDVGVNSYKGRNEASTTLSALVFGIFLDTPTVVPDEDGDYPSLGSLFHTLSPEVLSFVGSLGIGYNMVTATGLTSGVSRTFTIRGLGDILSIVPLSDGITFGSTPQVECMVTTDGATYIHSSKRTISPDSTVGSNISGNVSTGGRHTFSIIASLGDLNSPTFEVVTPSGDRKTLSVYADISTTDTTFPTEVPVDASTREWIPQSFTVGRADGGEHCLAPIGFVSDVSPELTISYEGGTATITPNSSAVAGNTYSYTVGGTTHNIVVNGRFSSASITGGTISTSVGSEVTVPVAFTSTDGGAVHKSEMPRKHYLVEDSLDPMSPRFTIDGMKVRVNSTLSTPQSVGLFLDWNGEGEYKTATPTITRTSTKVTVFTEDSIDGDKELYGESVEGGESFTYAFGNLMRLEGGHTYSIGFHLHGVGEEVADGDSIEVRFLNDDTEVLSEEITFTDEESDSNPYNSAHAIPIGFSNSDGRYLDSDHDLVGRFLCRPFTVSQGVSFDSIEISYTGDGSVDLYMVKLTDLGDTPNLVTSLDIEDSMPDSTDYLLKSGDTYSLRATPNIGSWNPTTGKLESDIDPVSFTSNTISLLKDHYYYITGLPFRYNNYRYCHMSLVPNQEIRDVGGAVYKATSSITTKLRMTYYGHSGTIASSDINPWTIALADYTPMVFDMGALPSEEACWNAVRGKNFISLEVTSGRHVQITTS